MMAIDFTVGDLVKKLSRLPQELPVAFASNHDHITLISEVSVDLICPECMVAYLLGDGECWQCGEPCKEDMAVMA